MNLVDPLGVMILQELQMYLFTVLCDYDKTSTVYCLQVQVELLLATRNPL